VIWLAWRQFRFAALSIVALLVAVAVIFLLTGAHMLSVYDTAVKSCVANADCSTVKFNLLGEYNKIYQFMQSLCIVLPALLGIFWGAPLIARELESGTYRLAWTQGVTRTRWLCTKVAVVGIASAAAMGVLAWMITWWASPLDTINANRFSSQVYDTHYLVPIGYGAFAFALGVTAGVLWRRTIPAMATTLGAYLATQLLFISDVRPHLLSPVTKLVAFSKDTGFGFSRSPSGPLSFSVSPPSMPNAWVAKTVLRGKNGLQMSSHWLRVNCAALLKTPPPGAQGRTIKAGAPPPAFSDCVNKIAKNFHELLTYQPASRFWAFQWYELTIYVVAAVVLCGASCWWVCRRNAR
jgi:hypothetical protein